MFFVFRIFGVVACSFVVLLVRKRFNLLLALLQGRLVDLFDLQRPPKRTPLHGGVLIDLNGR